MNMDTRHTHRKCGLRVRAFTSIKFCVKRWPFAASQVIASSLAFVYAEKMCWTSQKMISWKNHDAGTVGRHRNAIFHGFTCECSRAISQVLGRVQFAPFRWILMQLSLSFGAKNGTRCAHDKEEHVTNMMNAMHVWRWKITQNERVCACV